jgi:phospholipase/carboxylesterase
VPGVTANPHAGEAVVVEGDLVAARAVVVLLHGRDRPHADLRAALVEPCARPGLAFVCPRAEGGSWYPGSVFAPVGENEPRLGQALARVGQVVDEAVARVGRSRVVLAGFSQGACLACEWLYRDGRPLGGLVALTGGLIGPQGTTWAPRPSLAGVPVFLGTGDRDAYVSEARVRATAAVFGDSGAQVELLVYPGSDHVVTDAERAAFADLVADVMA